MKTIDTRDLYTRKCELESLRDAVADAREALDEARIAITDYHAAKEDGESTGEDLGSLEEAVETAESNLESAESDFGHAEEGELAELETLESEISDFMHGETMVPESYFKDYARELADDICDMGAADRWPFTCIDWKQAAEELAMDYTSVTYRGEDYLVRA